MSDNSSVVLVITGVLSAGYAVAALFFLRFWRDTRDRLFLFFAAAFALLMVQRLALTWAAQQGNDTVLLYVIRLIAFVLILLGIVDKNRAR